MQDKLIEAVAKAIFNRRYPKSPNPWEEIANDHLKGEYRADAIAAVRAHDAGKVSTAQNAVDAGEFFVTENRLKEVLASYHAAESTPQLDAEDSAEPVEDVVSRMCELMGGCACEHCIKRMTAALAVANQVRDDQWEATVKTLYYSADVIGFPAYIQAIKARLAPKPSPDPIEEVIATAICNECGARVGKRELHLKWHAALFPKTGGA